MVGIDRLNPPTIDCCVVSMSHHRHPPCCYFHTYPVNPFLVSLCDHSFICLQSNVSCRSLSPGNSTTYYLRWNLTSAWVNIFLLWVKVTVQFNQPWLPQTNIVCLRGGSMFRCCCGCCCWMWLVLFPTSPSATSFQRHAKYHEHVPFFFGLKRFCPWDMVRLPQFGMKLHYTHSATQQH